MLLRTKLFGKTYEFPDIRLLMGKANEEKSGDRLAGVAAETTAERAAAKFVLAEVPLHVLRAHPAVPYEQDEVTRVIQDAVNETIYNEIKDWTVGALREWLLADTTTGAMIRRIAAGLTAEMIAGVTKLMSNLDLIYGASKIRVSAHCANTIGAPGTLSSRNQPNHPTDSPEGIRASIYEGLSYGSGDSVIGINPVDDSYGSVARLLEMTHDIIRTWEIPTQNCVLSHVTTQMQCLRNGVPVGLVFQSLSGSQKGNDSFGISVGLLDEAYALAKKYCVPAGPNYMYFETGQGSAALGRRPQRLGPAHPGSAQLRPGPPLQPLPGQHGGGLYRPRNTCTTRARSSAPGWKTTSWASSPASPWAATPATPTTPAPTRTPSKTWR